MEEAVTGFASTDQAPGLSGQEGETQTHGSVSPRRGGRLSAGSSSLPCPPQECARTQFTGLSDDGQSRTFQVVDSGLQCEHGARVSARIAQERAAGEARKRRLEAQGRKQQK